MGKAAAEFSTGKAYAVGDLALYGGILYEFISAHSAGAWNNAQVKQKDSTIQNRIDRIIAGYESAQLATDYMATIVWNAVQIEGNRYKIVLSDAPDPRKQTGV